MTARRSDYRITALAAAVAALAAGHVVAQDAPKPADTPVADTIVVTGQRASLARAQDIKRNAEQIVDSIVADDIGKLPDANVAEALQRISGVQISRSRGEGDRVQVRGLQQTLSLLNGRDIFTAGKERGLSFQDIPAELLAGADVYKTPTADQLEGGIGGVIDLRTRRPFDFEGARVAGTVKGTQADLAKKGNAEGSLLLSNRWKLAAGDFGALLSVSTQKRNYRSDTQELDAPAAVADATKVIAPTGVWLAEELGQRERNAVSGALQFRPDAKSEYTLDVQHSQLKTRTDINGFYASPFWANYSSTANQGQLWSNGALTTDSNGRFVKGNFWGASMSTSGSVADEDTRINQISLAGKWRFDTGNLKAELTHTGSRFDRFYQEVRLGTFGDDPKSFNFDMSTALPSAYSPTAQLGDIGHYWADKALYFKIHNSGLENAARVDGDWSVDAGPVGRLRAGVRVNQRKASSAEINTIDDIWMFKLSDVPHVGTVGSGNLLSRAGEGNIPRQWLSINDATWLRDAAAVRGTFKLTVPAFDPTQTFDYKENTGAAYFSADLDSTLAGLPLTGNVGLRAVHTKSDRAYTLPVNGTPVSTSHSTTDNDLLPSLNLRLALSNDLLARLSVSRVVTRPAFDQLTPSLSLNVNDKTGYQGNPDLKPLRANQLDTTLEYYINKSDHVYGAAFAKQVNGFIQTTSSQQTIGGTTYTLSTPTNGSDGTVSGLEVGYQGFFNQLPGALRGLGLQANVTYVDSSAPSPLGTSGKAPLEGLSRNSYNIVGMYDLDGFSARLAYNWRSAYTVGSHIWYPSNDGKTALTPVRMQAFGMVDAYISYAITPQVKVAVEGSNLTGTVRRSKYVAGDLARGTYADDRRYAVSLHVDL